MRLGNRKLIRVFAKHEPYTDGHLGHVTSEMMKLGPPIVRTVEWRGDFFAVEGSHRLAAAYHLGLLPTIVAIQPDLIGPDCEAYWEAVKATLPHYSWMV